MNRDCTLYRPWPILIRTITLIVTFWLLLLRIKMGTSTRLTKNVKAVGSRLDLQTMSYSAAADFSFMTMIVDLSSDFLASMRHLKPTT